MIGRFCKIKIIKKIETISGVEIKAQTIGAE